MPPRVGKPGCRGMDVLIVVLCDPLLPKLVNAVWPKTLCLRRESSVLGGPLGIRRKNQDPVEARIDHAYALVLKKEDAAGRSHDRAIDLDLGGLGRSGREYAMIRVADMPPERTADKDQDAAGKPLTPLSEHTQPCGIDRDRRGNVELVPDNSAAGTAGGERRRIAAGEIRLADTTAADIPPQFEHEMWRPEIAAPFVTPSETHRSPAESNAI